MAKAGELAFGVEHDLASCDNPHGGAPRPAHFSPQVRGGQQRNHKAGARTHPHQSRPERMTSEPALHKLLASAPQRSSCLASSQCAIGIALSRSACTAAVLLVSVLVPPFT